MHKKIIVAISIFGCALQTSVSSEKDLALPHSILEKSKVVMEHRFGVNSIAFDEEGKIISTALSSGSNKKIDAGIVAACDSKTLINSEQREGLNAARVISTKVKRGKGLQTSLCLTYGSNNERLTILNLKDSKEVLNNSVKGTSEKSIALSSDGTRIAYRDGYLLCEDYYQNLIIKNLEQEDSVVCRCKTPFILNSVSFSSDGNKLVVTSRCGKKHTFEDKYEGAGLEIFDTTTGRSLGQFNNNIEYFINVACFSPDDESIAFGGSQNDVFVINSETLKNPHTFEGHKGSIYDLIFKKDGNVLASASWDHSIRFWNVLTRDCLAVLEEHHWPITCIAFNQDETCLASGDINGEVRLWDISEEEEIISEENEVLPK